MTVLLYSALLFLAYVGSRVFSKLCSEMVVGSSASGYALYFMYNGVVACGFFFIAGGFRISLNLPTVIYSAVFALCVILSIVGLFAYKLASVANVTIITTVSGLFATFALGLILFRESVDPIKIVRLVIMIAAILLLFFDKSKPSSPQADMSKIKHRTLLLVLVLTATTVMNSANMVITKYYAIDPNVTDENSFFFFTNVFLILFASILLIFDGARHHDHFRDALKLLNPKKAVAFIGSTVCSNISSLVGILLIALIDVSVYSPLTSAIGIISGVVASILFKEKLGVFSYLAALIACAAVFI